MSLKSGFLCTLILLSFHCYSVESNKLETCKKLSVINKSFAQSNSYLNDKTIKNQSYTNIVNVGADKKNGNWWDWIPHTSFIFTILSFFFTFWYTRRVAKRNKKDSVNDLFWLREVIFPNIIGHTLSFVNDSPSKYKENGSDSEEFFKNYYLEMANTLRDRCIVVTVVSSEFRDRIEYIIDELDASVSDVDDEDGLRLILSSFVTELFSALKQEQFN
ncbi:hypothetical protein [Pseudoalteromonas sp.]|uniref:hypothetical protein n=1 Tax=Pseudoalteromonas sp. TaxID=53249 RepID=UPI003D143499